MTLASLPLWQEKHRPQLKFSAKQSWLNDPNGMVYVAGEYHLFYQYYPDATVWGPMHWGHAVSKDLVHWEELDIALFPDEHGWIFSGCAVVDMDNLTGLQSGEEPLILAYFTYHNEDEVQAGKSDYQTQGLAYSNDLGRTWQKYHDNPVLKGVGETDFRDPKVIWRPQSKSWLMLLAAGKVIKFYHSVDLLVWQYSGEFGEHYGCQNGVWECPDLIQINAEDGTALDCLIVSVGAGAPGGGSGTQYFLGKYDEGEFIPNHSETLWLDAGMDNYAGVTWHVPQNVNEKRHLFIGWMNNQEYAKLLPTAPWRGNMTTVRELKLVSCEAGYRISSYPVIELLSLRKHPEVMSDISFTGHKSLVCQSTGHINAIELECKMTQMLESPLEIFVANQHEEYVTITLDPMQQRVTVNRENAGNVHFHPLFTNEISSRFKDWNNGLSVKVLADAGGIEVFINHGLLSFTILTFPEHPWDQFALSSKQQLFLDSCATFSYISIHKK